MSVVYYEGKFAPASEPLLPITDRGFQHGDGAYATLQVKEGVPLFFDAHLAQLRSQCCAFNLLMPPFERSTIDALIEANQAFQGIWRLKIFVSGGDSLDNRLPERQGRVMAILTPFKPLPFKPLRMGIFPIPYWSCHASFKSLAHLNRLYVMEEAYRQGIDDCITVTESGYVLEASFGNLIWIREKTVFTPDPALPIYFGVTLRNLLQVLVKKMGFELVYLQSKLSELSQEAAAFRTNTMQGIRPIVQIGEYSFAPHPTLQTLLLRSYEELIGSERQNQPASHY
jgi:branched-chain amino acid aminotransferase